MLGKPDGLIDGSVNDFAMFLADIVLSTVFQRSAAFASCCRMSGHVEARRLGQPTAEHPRIRNESIAEFPQSFRRNFQEVASMQKGMRSSMLEEAEGRTWTSPFRIVSA